MNNPDEQSSPAAFEIAERIEILAILRDLMRERTPINVELGNSGFVTTLLEISPDRLVLDAALDESLNRRLAGGVKATCVAQHHGVKVEFLAAAIQPIEFEAHPALSMPVPSTLARFQRREYYRLSVPMAESIKCSIPLPAERPSARIEVNVLDISCGGVALIGYPKEVELVPGSSYPGCRVALPGIGTIEAELEIRSSFTVKRGNGIQTRRSGCRFVSVSTEAVQMIQRYIFKIERDRKARESGLGTRPV